MARSRRTSLLLGLGTALSLVVVLLISGPPPTSAAAVEATPTPRVPPPAAIPLSVSEVSTPRLSVPWDIVFAPDGTMVYDQRWGAISVRLRDGTVRDLATPADFPDLYARGEGGLMGMALDPDFANPNAQRRRLYTCETTRVGGGEPYDQVRRWTIDLGWTKATRDATILTAPATPIELAGESGVRHAGCRLLFDRQQHLLASVGDAAVGRNPQDPSTLAGKVLRIDTDGRPVPGNPAFGGDPRVWTLGHRNPQGLALRPGANEVWETEHGPDVDDEVNLLLGGRNYGWNPMGADGGYDESVPMTAKGATRAKFRTGKSTLALSGATFLSGSQWGPWDGALVAVALKAQRLVVFGVGGRRLSTPVVPPELSGTFGRLRAARQGPDGALYLATNDRLDAAGQPVDRILRVVPAS